MTITLRRARLPDDEAAVLAIWREYIASVTVSLAFQDNETDFANLSAHYGPPAGAVILAERQGSVVGCVAMRPLSQAVCEMKRLYVRTEGRGHDLGRQLIASICAEARRAGYAEMRLDVLPEFVRARALYENAGFQLAEPHTFNPVPGTAFLGLRL